MAVLKIKSVPQKYTDELAYQQLLDYIMRSDKTPDHYIGGFAVHHNMQRRKCSWSLSISSGSRGSSPSLDHQF